MANQVKVSGRFPFTLQNLKRVNRIVYQRRAGSDLTLYIDEFKGGIVCWPDGDKRRYMSLESATNVVELIRAITGRHFTFHAESGVATWTADESKPVPAASNHPQVLRSGNVILIGGVESGDEPHFVQALDSALSELLGGSSKEGR